MDRWLLKLEPLRAQQDATSPTITRIVGEGGNEDTPMSDADEDDGVGGQPPGGGRFTAINQPWHRDAHNAALFDGSRMEEWYEQYAARVVVPSVERELPIRTTRLEVEEDIETETEEEEQEQEEENGATNGSILGLTSITFAASAALLSASPDSLTNERLLRVAAHYTTGEIAEQLRLLPVAELPARLAQTLTASISRVAVQRGVARKAVKGELDAARRANGVSDRMNAFAARRSREARARRREDGEVVSGSEELLGSADRPIEVEDEEEGVGVDAAGAASCAVPPRATPYGLGKGRLEEREIADSEESEEEL